MGPRTPNRRRLQWKAIGDAGWEARIDHCLSLAEHIEARLADPAWKGAFKLVMPRSCTNVCFWWVPPALRPLDLEAATERQLQELGRAAPAIKALMQLRWGLFGFCISPCLFFA